MTTGAVRHAKLPSNHQQTNTRIYKPVPFLVPNQQFQSAKGKKYHIPRTCTTQAHLGFSNCVLTIKVSQLPWGRVGKPLFSPLTPVLLHNCTRHSTNQTALHVTTFDFCLIGLFIWRLITPGELGSPKTSKAEHLGITEAGSSYVQNALLLPN